MKKTRLDRRLAGLEYEGRMIFLGQKVLAELRILARLARGAVLDPQPAQVRVHIQKPVRAS